jgi:uncharacterized membrane protein YfcA
MIEIWGTAVLAVTKTLAVISGIGGGGIVVPLLMVFYNMNTKEAVAISGFTMLMGCCCRYGIVLRMRHPDKDATTVDYSVANLMLPTVLLGSVTGVFINQLLPDIILQFFLCFVLFTLTWFSFQKSRELYNKESSEFDDIKHLLKRNDSDTWNQKSSEEKQRLIVACKEEQRQERITKAQVEATKNAA